MSLSRHTTQPEPRPRIPGLRSGGLMPTYQCSSQCGHCAYFSAPAWPHHFMDEPTARRVLRGVRGAGCTSVHIGGGEPFLGGERLVELCRWCGEEGVGIDYIETNSSWFTNAASARARLEALTVAGVDTVLVSMSPFHNAYIPWRKVEGVLHACREVGMGVFAWTEELGADVRRMDPETTHTMAEYEERFGPGYLRSIPGRYWVSPRGRSLGAFRRFAAGRSAEEVAAASPGPCSELLDTSHVHIDLYGNYIPGVCSGLAVDVDDLGQALDPARYPFLTQLMTEGIGALLEMARSAHGYAPERSFSGKCDLCYDIRLHLVCAHGSATRDLQPAGLYEQMTREAWPAT